MTTSADCAATMAFNHLGARFVRYPCASASGQPGLIKHFDVCAGDAFDSVKDRDRVGRRAVVIAEQHRHGSGVRADDGDAFDLRAIERQHAVVLQKHDGFARHLQRQRLVFGRVVLRNRNLRVRHFVRRIKQSEPEPRLQQVTNRGVNFLLRDQSLLHGASQAVVVRAAAKVATGFHRERRRLLPMWRRFCGSQKCRRSRRNRKRRGRRNPIACAKVP